MRRITVSQFIAGLVGVIALSGALAWAQTPAPPAITDAEIKAQIVGEGRRVAEDQWAQCVGRLRETTQKLAEIEAKMKSVAAPASGPAPGSPASKP